MIESERLNIRNWKDSDIAQMAKISGDPEVMQYFPSVQDEGHVADFVTRQMEQYRNRKHCYFAVELKDTHEFIGFVGLSRINFEATFTPSIDIGWRISKQHWGKGFATEAARSCLEYAWKTLEASHIVAVAPVVNTPSIHVMKKLNMQFQYNFQHPLLVDFPSLQLCSLYKIDKPQ